MFQTKVVEKIKTHFGLIFFFENRAVYEIISKKILQMRQATDEDTVHAHCLLDT